MDVQSSADPDEVRCEVRADVSWDVVLSLPDVEKLVKEMLTLCRNVLGEPFPCAMDPIDGYWRSLALR